MSLEKKDLKGKLINHNQMGGIETSVLDNGPGRGSRIAWFNTGSGLRFKVALDRAMDIADAFYNQYSLCWLSHAGLTTAAAQTDRGTDWLRYFGGGLLKTCGLTHIGQAEEDESEERGLHGRIHAVGAELESVRQPDPVAGETEMSVTGLMRLSRVFGPNLELKRTISATIGRAEITVDDVVTNRGNSPTPHMMLYHCNYGWPLVDQGSKIIWKGQWSTAGRDMDAEIFSEGKDFHTCPGPMDSHRGAGEGCAFIDAAADEKGLCHAGVCNSSLGLAVAMEYEKKQLPWLTNWQHWGPGEYTTGLEPGTNPPIGQNGARKKDELIYLEPGQSRSYNLRFKILTARDQIEEFIQKAGS